MTTAPERSTLDSPRGLRGPRRLALAAALGLAIILLVIPVAVHLLQDRAARSRLEEYQSVRTAISRVRTTSVLLLEAALIAPPGGSRDLDAAAADVDAALDAVAGLTDPAGLREPGDTFATIVRAEQAALLARVRDGGGAAGDARAFTARIAEAARDLSLAVAAAEDAWIAGSNRLGLLAALAQALAGLALLAVLANEALRRHRTHEAQARRMTHIAETMADAVIVRDAVGRITDWNDRAATLYGYTREEVLGRGDLPETLGDVLPFEDVMRTVQARGEILARRLVRRRKDGGLVHVDVSAFLLLDDAGRAVGTYSVNLDVTAAVRAAEALRRSEAYLRSVLDSSAIGIGAAVIDADGRIAFANAEFERLAPDVLGIDARSVIGTNIEGVPVEGAGVAPWVEVFRAGIGGRASSAEFAVTLQRWARVDGAPVWDEVGQHPGMTLIVRDITRARLDEERARAAEGRAAAIFHAAPVGLLVLDEQGTVEEVNAAVSEITGYSAAELLGRPAAILADVEADAHRLLITDAVARLAPSEGGHSAPVAHPERLDLRRRDGRSFPASLQVGVLDVRDRATGRPERKFLCAIADVSPQVVAEREARRVERMQALNTLVGGVAHDFNNLLTVIAGGIEIARTGQGDTGEWLERSAVASAQAAGLVRQLLRYSRPETDALEPVRFDEAVRETVSLVRATFDRRLVINFEAPLGEVVVQGNRSQLDQVVMNLLVNARDAVLARLEDEAQAAAGAYQPAVSVSLRRDPVDVTRIVLTVRDNGVGIPASVIEQVFDPFFTTKGPERGTGLGLATVY
ncbi:MAG: PAS domain S-box protein, partial [Dehalococcoidia bacterium]